VNNRQPIFASQADYQTLLNLLLENTQELKAAIHAYVLKPNTDTYWSRCNQCLNAFRRCFDAVWVGRAVADAI
jgi:hypothetical protein